MFINVKLTKLCTETETRVWGTLGPRYFSEAHLSLSLANSRPPMWGIDAHFFPLITDTQTIGAAKCIVVFALNAQAADASI